MAFGFKRKASPFVWILALAVFCISAVSARSKAVDQLSVAKIEDELQV
jgi:hypothetical protein